jgi:hypothetical protein
MTNAPVQLVTLAPGHFHAALVFKEMLPDVAPQAHIYAPLDRDLITHLDVLQRFNHATPPTAWQVVVHAGDDWLSRLQEANGSTVAIIAGRNQPKLALIRAAIEHRMHVLADKPCIINAADVPEWERLLADAEARGLLVRDIMTERHEVTTLAQRAFIHDRAQFGELIRGTEAEPTLELESVHYLAKHVAGVPLVRPTWWYDPTIAGRGLADVGTHLADLAQWLLFPNQALVPSDVELLGVRHWPTLVPVAAFLANTGQTCVQWHDHLPIAGPSRALDRALGRWPASPWRHALRHRPRHSGPEYRAPRPDRWPRSAVVPHGARRGMPASADSREHPHQP